MKKKRTNCGLQRAWFKLLKVMKLTTAFILLAVLTVHAKSYSQQTQLSFSFHQTSIADVLSHIEEKSEFYFFYKENELQANRLIDINVSKEDIHEILDQILEGTGLTYSVIDRYVVISAKDGVQNHSSLMQQKIKLTGKVTDTTGQPLPGVTVVVKGSTNGTITNFDGVYNLSDVPSIGTIQFSFVGMKLQEIPVDGKTTINVTMEEDAIGIEEVVAVGYGTMKKSDLTGAVTTANIDIFKESANVNIFQSLSGAVPGLEVAQVTSSGENPNLLIRGKNSVSGSSSPLIVIDGIIYSGSISSINTADVERIDVLKDASSAAVYGAAAANGVIIITTKQAKGNQGKPIFNYTTSYSLSTPTSMPTPLNAQQYYDKAKNIYWDMGGYLSPEYTQPDPNFDPTSVWQRNPLREGWAAGNDFNWLDEITQIGHVQDHLLSMSKSDETSNYYISTGYTNQLGYIMNDKYKRWTTRINVENKFTSWMKLGIRSYVSSEDYSGAEPNITSAYKLSPLVTPYDEQGNLVTYPDGQLIGNPFYSSNIDDLDKRLELNGTMYLDIDIPFVKGLNYKLTLNNRYKERRRFYFNQWSNSLNADAQKYNASEYNWTIDNIINYNKSFNDIHKISATLVLGQEEKEFEDTDARAAYYTNKTLGYNSLESGTAANSSLSSGAWNESSLYAMGRINYNYKSKYLATFTIRRDGYSGFAANKKWGTFPSAALAWVVSEENFIKENLSFLKYLKIRGSYGENGNRTSRYSSLARVSSSYQYVFGNGSDPYTGQYISTLSNNDLGWEKTRGLNLGVDFNCDWLKGNVEYYNTNTTDLFWNISLPTITGFSNIRSNVGKLNNTGVELSLTTTNIRTSELTWQTTFNFTRNRNKMMNTIDIDSDGDDRDDLISQNLFIGKSIDAIYDYTIDGIYQLDDEIPSGYYPGTYRLRDLNDDGSITPLNDRSIIGYKDPSYQFSILNTFAYKQFSLMININSIQGGKNRYMYINDPTTYISGRDNVLNDNTFVEWDFWYPANPDATYARIDGVRGAITPNVKKQRSFIRLQDISLSYKINNKVLERIGLRSAKIFVSGKNLLTLTKWQGWDPEADKESSSQGGLGLTSYGRPVMKSFTMGLDISF